MGFIETLVWLGVLVVDAAGQLCLKAGALVPDGDGPTDRWKNIFSNKWTWIGVASYVFEFILWLAFLSLVPLSQAVLVTSISLLTVMIGGRIFFNEKLTAERMVACVLIASGVALVGWA